MTRSIRWNKSQEGYCESKDGRWSISPLPMGTTRAQGYRLVDRFKLAHVPYRETYSDHDTQRDAKNEAERRSRL